MQNKVLMVAVCVSLAIGAIMPVVAFELGQNESERMTNNVPRVIPFAGQYSKAGQPFTGQVPMSFRLYDSTTSNSAKWGSSDRMVDVKDGVFSVVLGDGNDANSIENELFSVPSMYLEVVVQGTALTPRQRIAPAPQAVYSAAAGSAASGSKLEQSIAPVGTIMAFAGSRTMIPEGWLLCDGRGLANRDYPELGAVLEAAWGDGGSGCGQASCDFNLPDLRGVFLRGVNAGRTGDYSDPSANNRVSVQSGGNVGDVVGTSQMDALQIHTHKFDTYSVQNQNQSAPFKPLAWGTGMGIDGARTQPADGRFDVETRPKNVSVNYIIKY